MKHAKGHTVAPPGHLSGRAKQLWLSLVPRRGRSPERLALLQTALEALDRADQARVHLAREGLTTTSKHSKVVHIHPLARLEREARQQFVRIWNGLGLTWDYDLDSTRYPESVE